MPLNLIQKTFLCGESLASEDLNSIVLAINNTVNAVNTIKSNLEGHQYDVSVPITSIYCRTKKNINASGFFPQSDVLRAALFERVFNCSLSQGIKYNNNFLTISLDNNADNMNGVWTAYPQGISEELPHEWEASFKKLEDSNEIIFMFGPVLISNYGYSGNDGDGVLYVYKLFDRELTELERTVNTPTKPSNPDLNGEYIPSGWSDDPLNTTNEYPYQYVATLKRRNGTWGDFEKISLWSTYSEDGINGDTQIRVFCRFIPTSLKPSPNTPIGGTYDSPQPGSNDSIAWYMNVPSGEGLIWTSTRTFKGDGTATNWSTPVVESDTNELDIEYSSSVTKPDINTLRNFPGAPHPSNNVWHDPSESRIDLSTMIWRAERKIKNGVFEGNWVITKLTGTKGSFKSMVFKRFTPTIQQNSPATPSGGTYANPIPTGWSDGIPDGNGPVWASVCTFTEEDTEPVSSLRWSSPQIQHDSETLDIEFSPNENQPENPSGEPFSNRQSLGWYDPSASNFNSAGQMIWRAERKVINGSYDGPWIVSKIKGEKGDRGEFKSFVFKRSENVISSIEEADDTATYDNPIPNKTWSDSVPNGTATLWMAVSKFTGEGDEHSAWVVSQLSDSRDLDIEFSIETTKPSEPQGNPFLDRSQHTPAWYNSNLIPNGSTPIWRAERKVYEGKYRNDDPWVITRIWGERGNDAALNSEQVQILEKAGLEIIINPQNIILDLSDALTSSNDDKIDNDFTVDIIASKNGTELNVSDYLINSNSVLMYGNGNSVAFVNTNNTFFEIPTSQLNLYPKSIVIKNLPITTNNNEYTYTYNKGYIKGTIAITLDGTTYNVPFNIPWYLNKLGERESKILGDVETTYMSRNIFKKSGDSNNPSNEVIQLNLNSMIQEGADGRLANYSLIETVNGQKLSNVITKSAFATYLQTAELNLSNLKKTITGTNLLPLNNWTNISGTILSFETNSNSYSPFVYLNPGIYIFSCYSLSAYYASLNTDNNLNLKYRSSETKPDKPSNAGSDLTTGITHKGILTASANSNGDYYSVNNISYPRWYIKLIITEAKYYTLCITSTLSGRKFYRPLLELCVTTDETPTPWVPGPQEYSSEIKLTADSISLMVNSQIDNLEFGGKNLVLNGSFSKGTDFWSNWGNPTTRELYTDSLGKTWMHIITTSATFQGYLLNHYNEGITILPNETYTISFRAYSASGNSKVYAGFHWIEKGSTSNSSLDWYGFEIDTTDKQYSKTFTTPNNANIDHFNLMIGSNASGDAVADRNFYITEIQLERGTKVSDWKENSEEVYQSLAKTGIRISGQNRGIEMFADEFALKDSGNNLVFGKEQGSNNIKFTGDVLASSLTAGENSGLHIVTTGNSLLFMNNNTTVGRFVTEGNGLLLYILDNNGQEYKIDFSSWLSTASVGFSTETVYTINNLGELTPETIYKRTDNNNGNYYLTPNTSASILSSYICFVYDTTYNENDNNRYAFAKCKLMLNDLSDYYDCAFPVLLKRYKEISITGDTKSSTGRYIYYADNVPLSESTQLVIQQWTTNGPAEFRYKISSEWKQRFIESRGSNFTISAAVDKKNNNLIAYRVSPLQTVSTYAIKPTSTGKPVISSSEISNVTPLMGAYRLYAAGETGSSISF